jgi:hypothetical protein
MDNKRFWCSECKSWRVGTEDKESIVQGGDFVTPQTHPARNPYYYRVGKEKTLYYSGNW